VFALASGAAAAEIVYADGRRESVADPRQDGKGQWLATIEGRRTVLRPGEVVVIVDDAGAETVTIPALAEPPDPPETAAALAGLRDPKNDGWQQSAEQLARRPSRALLDALAALCADKNKELRRRGVAALARLRTRESVAAAAAAVVAEKDAALRRELASSLFSVQEIFRRADTAASVKAGVADKDAIVRVAFASLSPPDFAPAIPVLEADGLGSADHHVRESAAMELGERGDASGEGVLVSMLARTSMPGVTDDPALMERLLVREQVAICRILGKLGTPGGKAALEKAKSSKFDAVRKAAEAALAAAK
jgi:HEAT repeat protein